jgi:hypothetical protein
MVKNIVQNNCDLPSIPSTNGTPQLASNQGLVLCQQSTSASSSINFTNFAQYPYTNFLLTYDIFYSTGNGGIIQMLASINNATTSFVSSGYVCDLSLMSINTSTGTTYSHLGSTSYFISLNWVGTPTQVSGQIYLFGMNTTSLVVEGNGTAIVSATAFDYSEFFGILQQSSNINALQISSTSGAVLSAKYNLWGING